MAREVFGRKFFGGEEEKIIQKIDRGEKMPGAKEHDWWEDWDRERQEIKAALEESYDEAVKHYETALGIPPPKSWDVEDIIEALDEEANKERETRGWPKPWQIKRGHRHGKKPEKHGRETIRKKAA